MELLQANGEKKAAGAFRFGLKINKPPAEMLKAPWEIQLLSLASNYFTLTERFLLTLSDDGDLNFFNAGSFSFWMEM